MLLRDVLAEIPYTHKGRTRYYRLIDVREKLLTTAQDRFPVEDGVCLSLFCLLPGVTYELYAFEFGLSARPDPEETYRIIDESERGSEEPWHERLRCYSPIFVKEDSRYYPKEAIMEWINYILREPEVMGELRSLFGKDVTEDDLYVCAY